MNTKHTPGPWTTHRNIGKKSELGIMADAAPCIIAIMGGSKEWPFEANANARLIAAAPELLSTLQDIHSWLISPDLSEGVRAAYQEDCRVAIAKALGGKV